MASSMKFQNQEDQKVPHTPSEQYNLRDPPSSFSAIAHTEKSSPSPQPAATSRLFHIYIGGTLGGTITVKDATESEILYTCANHAFSHPNISFTTLTGEVVATVAYSTFSTSISCTIDGKEINMCHRPLRPGFTFPSPALNNQQLSWKGAADSVLLDEKEMPLAKIEVSWGSWSKMGKVQVMDGVSEDATLEALVTATAIMEMRRRRTCYTSMSQVL